MKKKKEIELTPQEEKELLREFERVAGEDDSAIPPAPTGEFEKIIAEMEKRNIVPRIREELENRSGKK